MKKWFYAPRCPVQCNLEEWTAKNSAINAMALDCSRKLQNKNLIRLAFTENYVKRQEHYF